jgi:hypothetical protein
MRIQRHASALKAWQLAVGHRVSDEFAKLHRSGDEIAWWQKLPVALRLRQHMRADGELVLGLTRRMTSFRQIKANRLNALASTSPRTEDGKRRSRRKAVRHGLTALPVATYPLCAQRAPT